MAIIGDSSDKIIKDMIEDIEMLEDDSMKTFSEGISDRKAAFYLKRYLDRLKGIYYKKEVK